MKYIVEDNLKDNSLFKQAKEAESKDEAKDIYIKELRLHESDKFRKNEAKIDEIAKSIEDVGLLSPLLVVVDKDLPHMYKIIAGKHRYFAARKVGLSYLKCIVMEDIDEQEVNAIIAASNKQREDISTIERAYMIKYDYELVKKRRGMDYEDKGRSLEKIAKTYNMSVTKAKRILALTNLIAEFCEALDKKTLKEAAAYRLSFLEENMQRQILKAISEENFKMNKLTEELVGRLKNAMLYLEDGEAIITGILRDEKAPKKSVKEKDIYREKNVFASKISKARKQEIVQSFIYDNLDAFKNYAKDIKI